MFYIFNQLTAILSLPLCFVKFEVISLSKVSSRIFYLTLFGVADGWGGRGKKSHFPKICHTYPTIKKLGNYTLPKEEPKAISRNTDIDCILMHNF